MVLLALLLVLGALAGGCGSSKKSSTAPTITKAQFLAQGNAICKQGEERLASAQKAIEKALGKHEPTPAQLRGYVTGTLAPLIQFQIDRLRSIGAPAGEQAKVANLLKLAQSDVNHVKVDPTALIAERHPFASFARTAHSYGLTECAKKA